ncbi:hypothetical protein ACVT98_26680 (plasmid) [Vibrio campbellii]|nr:hypothetical protein [Vibrio parahaemolyticus]
MIEIVTIIAMIAAVIAAVPIIMDWLPPPLSNKERDVLLLASSDNSYPYMILFVCGIGKAYVQAPFKHDTSIYISDELATLVRKNLIEIVFSRDGGSYIGDGQFIWYVLTKKGIKTLNRLNS